VKEFPVKTNKRCEFADITRQVADIVRESGAQSGVAYIFVPHTTAGVTINENADPDVKRDLLYALERMAPNTGFIHSEENSDAHTKALLTGASLSVIFEGGRLCLGTWQSIYFCEYDGPRSRRVFVKILKNNL
jgi:secondary thiamine-phosphate synthase enzyme